MLVWEFALSSYPLVISRGSWEKTVLFFFFIPSNSRVHLRNTQIWPWGHIQFISICKMKFKPEFKRFAGWAQCLRCQSLRLSGHPALLDTHPWHSSSWTCQRVTASSKNPGPGLQRLGGTKNPPSHWACTYQSVSACWAKGKILDTQEPLKPVYFNGRACMKPFLSALKLMFTSSCHQIITAMKVFLGYPVQTIFFLWQSDFSSYQQRTWNGRSKALIWQGQGTHHRQEHAAVQGVCFIRKNLFPCRHFNP